MYKLSALKWHRQYGIIAVSAVTIFGIIAVILVTSEPRIRLGSETLRVTWADTDETRRKGLSGVRSLEPNQAMLFVFPSDERWGIWMKDMHIPIDILWLDSERRIIHIESDVKPDGPPFQTYGPATDARYVIETAAGTVARSGVEIGDRVGLNLNGRLRLL